MGPKVFPTFPGEKYVSCKVTKPATIKYAFSDRVIITSRNIYVQFSGWELVKPLISHRGITFWNFPQSFNCFRDMIEYSASL